MLINHNMYSLGIYKSYARNLQNNSDALGKISSGLAVRNAKDNPNKLVKAESLRMSVLGRNAASSNIQNTTSMLQTFDGSLQEYNNNVKRLKTLAVQSANDTYTDEERKSIQEEVDGILASLKDLGERTEFNGITLSKEASAGTDTSVKPVKTGKITSSIGDMAGESIDIPRFDISNEMLFGGNGTLDMTSRDSASNTIEKIESADNYINQIRSTYGALQSRLDGTDESLNGISQTMTEAQSSIQDADIGLEMMNYCRDKILIDSGIGLMAQSNKIPMDALNVLSNLR